jgi:hypothetical protein
MTNKISGIIDKVQKLLALSHSSNANEAAAAAAAANKLIDQYRLSEADLSSSDEDPLIEDDGFIYETGRIVPWKNSLAVSLATHYGCAIFNSVSYHTGRKVSHYKLIGRKSDIQLTRYMFNWLSMECSRLSEKEAYGQGRVFVASYCQGFVAGVKQQLVNSRNEVKQNATSAAIIKIDAREQEANAFMNKLYKLKNTKNVSASQIDPRAFDAGMNRGKNIHLGGAIAEGSGTKMLGSGS